MPRGYIPFVPRRCSAVSAEYLNANHHPRRLPVSRRAFPLTPSLEHLNSHTSMSNSIPSDSKELASIVQPGSTFLGCLPDPLSGELRLSEKPTAQGTYSDVYRGWLQQNGVEIFVCVKILRRCSLEGHATLTAEERFERVRVSNAYGIRPQTLSTN